ncbi:MAG: anti-sigma F factor [Clostridia bacterium]|nr:anti-sigma F factor [Clostridia bacterium]
MYDNEMELSFISKSNNEAFARITVAAFAAQLDPTIEELADIKTAISEAVTNCIIHGYEDTEGTVKIKAKLLDNMLEVEITDNGKGIEDIELARKPLYTTKGNLERSGMGFTIMESFMDSVEIQSVVGIGTKIVMKKAIKKEIKQEEIEEEKNALIN